MDELFKEKTILITGGTGFLGRALVSRLLKLEPKAIRVFSNSEVEYYQAQELLQNNRIRHLFGDVRDLDRLKTACEGVDIVIHAAALKRIDLIEYNVMDAIKTNVDGTMNVVKACLAKNVPKAVFISTDKACNPINSYGATKMLGEKIFIESNFSRGLKETAFTVVRYGNVLDSTGSVIPFFLKRLNEGKDLPITDKAMTRFIITADLAIKMIFEALEYGEGGELFVPNLDSVKVTDLAEVLSEEIKPGTKTRNVGIRPGEKIHEELLNQEECRRAYYLNDCIVVLSEINYPIEEEDPPKYLKGKKPFEKDSYSSKDYLIGKDKIKAVLKEEKIL